MLHGIVAFDGDRFASAEPLACNGPTSISSVWFGDVARRCCLAARHPVRHGRRRRFVGRLYGRYSTRAARGLGYPIPPRETRTSCARRASARLDATASDADGESSSRPAIATGTCAAATGAVDDRSPWRGHLVDRLGHALGARLAARRCGRFRCVALREKCTAAAVTWGPTPTRAADGPPCASRLYSPTDRTCMHERHLRNVRDGLPAGFNGLYAAHFAVVPGTGLSASALMKRRGRRPRDANANFSTASDAQ
jgi:hypothetical protein